ncbi:hypothetical protein F2P79_000166 [Pimephales promelas]|nr:hypothetical protein F2P79_000166 [Pimephales promelas]
MRLRTTLPTILFTRSVTRQVFFSAHLHSSHYNTKHHRLFTVSLIAATAVVAKPVLTEQLFVRASEKNTPAPPRKKAIQGWNDMRL